MTRWSCSAEFLCRDIHDGTLFVVHPTRGDYVSLNGTAKMFLDEVRRGHDLERVLDRFERHFRIPRERLRDNLRTIASELEHFGILVRHQAQGGEACT